MPSVWHTAVNSIEMCFFLCSGVDHCIVLKLLHIRKYMQRLRDKNGGLGGTGGEGETPATKACPEGC